ncbi:protein of unknown function [Georgfuchsia toluolica]|uniref:Uncharacterized protein n=1 Tax=Georgfuchsia toluolica TaxID=424218 RepID=A0A916J2E3_9PROT|nr:protein of unknown function [Georgfuchsia toluolica]
MVFHKSVAYILIRHSGRRVSGEPESSDFSRPWIPAFVGMTPQFIQCISDTGH